MEPLDGIVDALRNGRYRITDHAADELAADDIAERDLIVATASGEVIEDYPEAFPFPACLVLGALTEMPAGPVHAVWALDPESCYAFLVTAYRPDPTRWSSDLRRRITR